MKNATSALAWHEETLSFAMMHWCQCPIHTIVQVKMPISLLSGEPLRATLIVSTSQLLWFDCEPTPQRSHTGLFRVRCFCSLPFDLTEKKNNHNVPCALRWSVLIQSFVHTVKASVVVARLCSGVGNPSLEVAQMSQRNQRFFGCRHVDMSFVEWTASARLLLKSQSFFC